ncbi:MAG: hypothetical protein GY757_34450 [bacterium]|nr:hypothetical protein [bacterium]
MPVYNPFLGKNYSKDEMEKAIARHEGLTVETCENYREQAAKFIADGLIVGWFQGRSETGPRALGNRSILADARRKDMKDILNERVKFRESFRPFAPVVMWEHQQEYFDLDIPSPYMLVVADIFPEKQKVIPSVTHVDGTGRLQTVLKELNPVFHSLLDAFYQKTGVPVILNTSFNIKGEPIVESPADALNCFMGTRIDKLVMGEFIISKP